MDCAYRKEISYFIENQNVRYIFDIHGLAKNRPCDINLGTYIGNNVQNKIDLFDKIKNDLSNAGFSVSIDQPFMAGYRTISGTFAKKYNIFTLQVEINSRITNDPSNIGKCNKLLNIFINILNSINS